MIKKHSLTHIAAILSVFPVFSFIKAMEWPQPPQKPHASAPLPAKTEEQLRAKRLKLAIHSGNLQGIMENATPQNVNLLDGNGFTPLYYAPTAPVAALLIYYGANTHARNNNGLTPLHQAAFLNRLDVVRLLVEPGRWRIDFQPLALALVEAFFSRECPEVDCPHRAKLKAQEKTIPESSINNYLASNAQRLAIPANASDIQRGTLTPLWYAVLNNAQDVAEYLLSVINRNPEMIFPTLNEQEPGTLRSIAHIATTPAMINLLARYNFPLNMEERYQYTPLEVAAANNQDNLVRALVTNHALINGPVDNPRPTSDSRRQKVVEVLKRIYQYTNPLLYAVLIGDFDEAQKILEAGQSTLVQGSGLSGFFGRLTGSQQTEAERLLTTQVGNLTPLRAAIGQRSRPLTALLITYGALANATTTQIREFEELARTVSSPEVTSLFLLLRDAANDEARRKIAQRYVEAPVADLETAHEPMTQNGAHEVEPAQEPVRLTMQHALEHLQAQLPSVPSGFGGHGGGGSQRD